MTPPVVTPNRVRKPAFARDSQEIAAAIERRDPGLYAVLAAYVYPGRTNHRGRELDIIAQTLRRELPQTLLAVARSAEAIVAARDSARRPS